jgi:hypothetical protein
VTDKRVFLTEPQRNKVTYSYEEKRLTVHAKQNYKVTRNLQGLVVQQQTPTKNNGAVSNKNITVQQKGGVTVKA